jgi:hypothetical protein
MALKWIFQVKIRIGGLEKIPKATNRIPEKVTFKKLSKMSDDSPIHPLSNKPTVMKQHFWQMVTLQLGLQSWLM